MLAILLPLLLLELQRCEDLVLERFVEAALLQADVAAKDALPSMAKAPKAHAPHELLLTPRRSEEIKRQTACLEHEGHVRGA